MEAEPQFMDRIITGEESWFSPYDPETKRQSLVWRSKGLPIPKKARISRSKVKFMLVYFFDAMTITYIQRVSQYCYTGILGRFKNRVMWIRPSIAKNLTLHHDNAPAHTTLSVAQFWTSKRIMVMPLSPYSPDLASCDFFFFQNMESAVKGYHFESTEDIQGALTQTFNDIPHTVFQECYKQLQHRWKSCVQAQGMYFEGNHIVFDE